MTSERPSVPPGWYPHPEMPGSLGYWDGDGWTEHVAPGPAPNVPPPKQTSVLTVASGVALGLILVIALVMIAVQFASANDDIECATENAERAIDGRPTLDCR